MIYQSPVQANDFHPNTQAYFDGIQRILLGQQTAQESMDLAAQDIQALLDQ